MLQPASEPAKGDIGKRKQTVKDYAVAALQFLTEALLRPELGHGKKSPGRIGGNIKDETAPFPAVAQFIKTLQRLYAAGTDPGTPLCIGLGRRY